MNTFNTFRINIEEYYTGHKRKLPWRKDKPVAYEVWLSEIIMQQTRVAQGTPYYEKILAAFPNVETLASAPEDELLALWTGLGYYNRARNLQKGARQIVQEHDSKLPSTYKELLTIAGIGPYTAAAIASICFNEVIGVVDGNVYRVLSRYFGIDTPTNSSKGIKLFQEMANECIKGTSSPANYNQGIMEFGALHCTPKKPACLRCPIISECSAFQNGQTSELPVKLKKSKRNAKDFHFAVVQTAGKWALRKRDTKGIWAGLYEFPQLSSRPAHGHLLQDPIVHKLTHLDLTCHFWEVPQDLLSEPLIFYSKEEMTMLGMPIIIANFVENKLKPT
mgnify:FL=1